VIRRGAAYRNSIDSFELFPPSYKIPTTREISETDERLVNNQRLIVNDLLAGELRENLVNPSIQTTEPDSLWRSLSREVGEAYFPKELMTDSRAVALGHQPHRPTTAAAARIPKSLDALESSEQKGEEAEPGSPKSQAGEEEPSDDDSMGGADYNLQMDFEDEGARDDYDDGGDDGGGGDEF
jgi:hypothetical protein